MIVKKNNSIMKNEKKYLKDLIELLKLFLTLEEEEEKEEMALELNVKWQIPEEDEVRGELRDISSSLALLENYALDPAVHDEIISQILVDAKLLLKNLEGEKQREPEIEDEDLEEESDD
jgi:hypothetical protein